MKKLFCLLLFMAMLVTLMGCVNGGSGSSLPKGHAKSIDIDYGSGIVRQNVEFEYLTETSVKITEEDGSVYIYPLDKIERICIE